MRTDYNRNIRQKMCDTVAGMWELSTSEEAEGACLHEVSPSRPSSNTRKVLVEEKIDWLSVVPGRRMEAKGQRFLENQLC